MGWYLFTLLLTLGVVFTTNQLFIIHIYIISNISLRFSSNSEAKTSVLLEDLEEMFHQCYMHWDMFSMFKSLTTYHYGFDLKSGSK